MSRYAVRRSLLLAPLSQHKGRFALSVLAIALGVALGYAVQLINHAAISEFAAAVQTLSGEADLAVRGPRAGFDESLYPRLARLPEVAVASPVLEVEARLPGRREALRILGLDLFRAARIQPFLSAGDWGERLDFLRPDRIFLAAAASESLGLNKGDALSVQVGLRVLSLQVAGVLGEARRQRFAVIDIGAAQAIFLRPGLLNRIDLRLRPGADPERLAERLRAEMPPGTLIERPDADIERSDALSRAYRVNLNVLALVALFTGGLLVFSAQALAVVRRRAQLALLRVLGMTRRELVAMLLAEAAVVGAVGALAGIALGHASAVLVLQRFGAELGGGYFRGLAPSPVLDWLALALFFSLGILAAVLGSLAPALEAAGAEPAPALKAGDEERALRRLQPVWPGLAVLLAGAALTQAGPVSVLPADVYLRAGPGSDTAFLSPADQQTIATLPGARRVEFLRSQRLVVAPDRPPLTLLARAVEAEGRVPPLLGAAHALKPGDPPAAWVSEVASDLYGWRPGAVIELPLGGRRARFTVAGVWRDYARQQGVVLIERYEYLRHTGDAFADDAALWLAPGADPASVTREIQARVAGATNLEIAGPGEIREVSLRMFDRTFAVTYALEAVAVVIGLFGLSSSFGALVLSRRREFGVLRHIGMTRRQIGSMLAAQGLLVSALGLAVGLTLGWVISLVLIHVVNRHSFHWGMELHLPWQLLAEFVAVMLVLATVTAVASGRQAMRSEERRVGKG